MIRNAALLLVLVLVTGAGRLLICGVDCPDEGAAQPAACHDDQRSASDAIARADARHGCDHVVEQTVLVAGKPGSSLQTRFGPIAGSLLPDQTLSSTGLGALILARPPGRPTRAPSSLLTVLRI